MILSDQEKIRRIKKVYTSSFIQQRLGVGRTMIYKVSSGQKKFGKKVQPKIEELYKRALECERPI